MNRILSGRLMIEDLEVTLKCITYNDPISHAVSKYKGKTSKRRFMNIMKMRYKRYFK